MGREPNDRRQCSRACEPRFDREPADGEDSNGRARLTLGYRPPLAWEAMLDFLRPRIVAGVELVADGAYLRTVAGGWIRVERDPDQDALAVDLPSASADDPDVVAGLRRLFDLDADPKAIDDRLARDPALREDVRREPGLRVPGAFDPFELAVRAVLGQQISVRGASTLAGRYARALGEPIATPFPELDRLGPTPARVAAASVDELAALGLVRARAECVGALAAKARDEPGTLEPGDDLQSDLKRLTSLKGIGLWTASYIAMRALRRADAFPHLDLGLRKALKTDSPAEILTAAEPWRPYRAYAAMRLWRLPTPS